MPPTRRPSLSTPIAAGLLLILVGCGTQVADGGGSTATPTGPATSPTATSIELTGFATVLQVGDAKPQLCLGGVATSLPPQCGGPEIANWDWAKVPTSEHAATSRWGEYAVTGTFRGNAFTLTRPVTTREAYAGPRPRPATEPSFPTPCEKPPGGWRVVNPATTTQETQDATLTAAQALPGYAGAWLDQSLNPATETEAMNDPRKLILNIRVTGDPEAAAAVLRETWGGALCVSAAEHTEAELLRLQETIHADQQAPVLRRPTASGIEVTTNSVSVTVPYDDGTLQREYDAAYGRGLVRVGNSLWPAE